MKPNSIDKIGTSIGALSGWRPRHYKVSISGYPGGNEIQKRSFDKTLNIPKSKLSKLPKSKQNKFLFIRNDVRWGMSGSPVWIKRHWSKGGRIAFAVLLGMDAISGKRYATCRLITSDVKKFISDIIYKV